MLRDDLDATLPRDALAAVTHPDPYDYYARLVTQRPFERDSSLGLWIASSAEAVTAVLTHPRARVRPAGEPVPLALLGTTAGEIFSRLVRMNDGRRPAELKGAIVASLDGTAGVRAVAEHWAQRLIVADPAAVTRFACALPAHTLAALLGVPEQRVSEVAEQAGSLATALAPAASPEHIASGIRAAAALVDTTHDLLTRAAPGSLLARLLSHAGRSDPAAVVANAIGFLTQAYEATAALIAATLLTLARHPELLEAIAREPDALHGIIDEVARFDAPVQNTRRYFHEPAEILGRTLDPGDAVLVVLAAANRDPQANPDPHVFDAQRRDSRVFTFGLGAHTCPGGRLALEIARSGVESLLTAGVDPRQLRTTPPYRPSLNCRMPLLDRATQETR